MKPEEVPQGYINLQRRIAREQGHGNVRVTDAMRAEMAEVITRDQRASLRSWAEYLGSSDVVAVPAARYWALRSVLAMTEYNQEAARFGKRSKTSTQRFPDLDPEALALVFNAMDQQESGRQVTLSRRARREERKRFREYAQTENFAGLYSVAFAVSRRTQKAVANTTDGKWVKFRKGANPKPLVDSLDGQGTGWCTAGVSTAKRQLDGGDFYVYYSLDRDGEATIPRAAIRMQGGKIAEVRGVARHQNLDREIAPVVETKLAEFPDGKNYQRRADDMKRLTAIERKIQDGGELSKRELRFLYERDRSIQGFGQRKDPRIAELRRDRDEHADFAKMFGVKSSEVALSEQEFSAKTRVYRSVRNKKVLVRTGRVHHRKRLAAIEERMREGRELSNDQLRLLYGVDATSFSKYGNLLVRKLLQDRDARSDLAKLFGVKPAEVTLSEEDLSAETRVYYSGGKTYPIGSSAPHHKISSLGTRPIRQLPDKLRVGNLRVGSRLTELPAGLRVDHLSFNMSPVSKLPADLQVAKQLSLKRSNVTRLPEGLRVETLDLSRSKVDKLPAKLSVDTLDLSHSEVTEVPASIEVKDWLILGHRIHQKLPKVVRAKNVVMYAPTPELEGVTIEGDLHLSSAPGPLPEGLTVKGTVHWFRSSQRYRSH
jgi:hypothetical protein